MGNCVKEAIKRIRKLLAVVNYGNLGLWGSRLALGKCTKEAIKKMREFCEGVIWWTPSSPGAPRRLPGHTPPESIQMTPMATKALQNEFLLNKMSS